LHRRPIRTLPRSGLLPHHPAGESFCFEKGAAKLDAGRETQRTLDGQPVAHIHPNLTSGGTGLTRARVLPANFGRSFMGSTKGGAFDIGEATALDRLLVLNQAPARKI
jgi:hypothetical protein